MNNVQWQAKSIVWFIFFLTLLLIISLSVVLVGAHYGLDYTDEGYYLNWMAYPSSYKASLTQFGFIYHPFYVLLKGQIAQLRQGNILLTYGLATLFCIVYFVKFLDPAGKTRDVGSQKIGDFSPKEIKFKHTVLFSFLIASSSLIYFYVFGWLPSPSYNGLTLQSLIITSIGIVLTEKHATRQSMLGWIIIGCGGWLLFMAKPQSAILLAVLVLIYSFITKKCTIRLLMLAAGTCISLLLISAWVIDGSLSLFIQRYQLGYNELSQLGGHKQSFFRLGYLSLSPKQYLLLFINSGILVLANYLVLSSNKRTVVFGLSLLLVFLFTSLGYLLINLNHYPVRELGALQLWAIPLSALISVPIIMRSAIVTHTSSSSWLLCVLFLFMPYIQAFGTSNNYWMQSQFASFFYVMAGIALLVPVVLYLQKLIVLVPTIVFAQCMTLFLLIISIHYPYRQDKPLYKNTELTTTLSAQSDLYLSKDVAHFIQSTQASMKQIGLNPGTEVLDISGISPGILNVLGLKSLGQPWIVGGYPGSNRVISTLLHRLGRDKILNSWILVEPDGLFSISLSVLHDQGIELEQDYVKARVIILPAELDATNFNKQRILVLYAPKKKGL
ncbi:MAG: hypothetical protein WC627_00065 [Legionella sp.]|jgi:hypothetical protein